MHASVPSVSVLPPVVTAGFNFSHCGGRHWQSRARTQRHVAQRGAAAGAVQRPAEETREGFILQLVETLRHA